jgi:hypothetical protein
VWLNRNITGYAVTMAKSHHRDKLLGIYLNDHLAGAVGGAELAQRLATADRHRQTGRVLEQLASEIVEDRIALLDIMATLRLPIRRYKTWAAWTVEKIARLKLNGHLLTRSPLSRVIELEVLRLGVEGKAACWRTLRALARWDRRLDTAQLDELIHRARRQIDQLEQLRVQATVEAFGGEGNPAKATQDGQEG